MLKQMLYTEIKNTIESHPPGFQENSGLRRKEW